MSSSPGETPADAGVSVWDELQEREAAQAAEIRSLLGDQVDRIAASVNFGEATASKRGRTAARPYVPVIRHTSPNSKTTTTQLRGLAYPTREEALERARKEIAGYRARLAKDLCSPRKRAMREKYGLPRDPLSQEIS